MIRVFTERYFRAYFNLIQSCISIVTSTALEFQFLFEILNNVLFSSHKCDNANIFVKTPGD